MTSSLIFQILSPTSQFEIKEISFNAFIGGFTLLNIGFYFILSFLVFITIINGIFIYGGKALSSNRLGIGSETLYTTIESVATSGLAIRKGELFLPFIFSLFTFILINNLIGLFPYSFATTSHFIVTLSLSFMVVIGATILGLWLHNIHFFSLFVPAGCPLVLLPLLTGIEILSYLSRCLSLGLRLGANITAGHLLLHIISTFIFNMMTSGLFLFLISLLPLGILVAFCGLELAIAFIQALVFIILTSSYIKDGLVLH